MSDGIFKIVTCDRCGFEVRIPREEAKIMGSRVPDGWGFALGTAQETDLCPACYKEYKRLTEIFMRRERSR